MKSLIRSHTYSSRTDHDIEKRMKTCRSCTLAAKSPPVKFQPWSKNDIAWAKLCIDYVGPLNGLYYSCERLHQKAWGRPTSNVTISFLLELFAHFGHPEMAACDNGTVYREWFKRKRKHLLNILLPLDTTQVQSGWPKCSLILSREPLKSSTVWRQKNKEYSNLWVVTASLAKWLECSSIVLETWVQSQVTSYRKPLKWYMIPPSLILRNIRYISRIKWCNSGKGVGVLPYTSVL